MQDALAGLARFILNDLVMAFTEAPLAVTMIALGSALKARLHLIGLAIVVAIGFTLYADLTLNMPAAARAPGIQIVIVGFRTVAALFWGFVGWWTGASVRRKKQDKTADSK